MQKVGSQCKNKQGGWGKGYRTNNPTQHECPFILHSITNPYYDYEKGCGKNEMTSIGKAEQTTRENRLLTVEQSRIR